MLDDGEFGHWYQRTHPGLVDAVVRAVRSTDLAADAVDEAFTRAFERWDRVQAMASPSGWVYRVAVNEARRQLRRATKDEAIGVSLRPGDATAPPGDEAWFEVDRLPPRQRAAVVLRHVAGLTEAEIGRALGVTRSTVSSNLADAHRALAARLPRRELTIAVVLRCVDGGCELDRLDGRRSTFARYSDAVRDRIRVRPHDLVAVDEDGPSVVWRWWGGRVEDVDGRTAAVSREVTGEPQRRTMDVAVPADLREEVVVGETVWFGTEADGKVIVAVAGRADRATAMFPAIRQVLG